MIPITVYNISTGKISGNLYVSDYETAALQCAEGESWVSGEFDPDEYFFNGDQMVVRQGLSWSFDTVAPVVLSLPVGSKMVVRNMANELVETSDPSDLIEIEEAGTYQVSIYPPFPYIPLHNTIEVTDA